tara:strand:+ start:668 stop:1051 length:384 start_codon:yes stop_codon:yes gene_type:complete
MILKKKIDIIKNPKGDIIKYINKKNNFLKRIKEVYFTEIIKGRTKGWIKHTKTKCFILIIKGKIKFFYTKNLKKKKTITLSSNKPVGIIVKPGTWFAFKSLAKKSILVNSIEIYHSPKESIKYQIDN